MTCARRALRRLACEGRRLGSSHGESVRSAAAAFGVATVLLPTVAAAEELAFAHDALAREGLSCGGIMALVETQRNISRVAEMVGAAAELRAPVVGFGYHDYCLDFGCWPFPRHHELGYWQFAACVAELALAASLRYLHPPDPELRDGRLLGELLARQQVLCGSEFVLFSASKSQAAVLRRLTAARAAVPRSLRDIATPIGTQPAMHARQPRQ